MNPNLPPMWYGDTSFESGNQNFVSSHKNLKEIMGQTPNTYIKEHLLSF